MKGVGLELVQGRIEREQEVTLDLGIGRSKVSQGDEYATEGIREPLSRACASIQAACRVDSSQMGLPRLTDECPEVVGAGLPGLKGGSDSGLWSVGGKEVVRRRKRRRWVWLRISFSCFTGPLLGRNTLQNPGEAESEDREKRERGQRGSELVAFGPLRCSEFLAPIANPQYLPRIPTDSGHTGSLK